MLYQIHEQNNQTALQIVMNSDQELTNLLIEEERLSKILESSNQDEQDENYDNDDPVTNTYDN